MPASQPIGRPAADEYAPFYGRYVERVPDGDPLAHLAADAAATRRLYEALGDAVASEPYAPGKWTPKDVLQHVTDTERIMAYRALCVARGDATPLPGFEQDDYAREAGAAARPLAALLDEFVAVRAASVALFQGLAPEAMRRRGVANGQPVSARALLHVILGHARHHESVLGEHLPALAAAGAAS